MSNEESAAQTAQEPSNASTTPSPAPAAEAAPAQTAPVQEAPAVVAPENKPSPVTEVETGAHVTFVDSGGNKFPAVVLGQSVDNRGKLVDGCFDLDYEATVGSIKVERVVSFAQRTANNPYFIIPDQA